MVDISSTPTQYVLKWSNLALGQYVIVHIFAIKLTAKDKEWSTHKLTPEHLRKEW